MATPKGSLSKDGDESNVNTAISSDQGSGAVASQNQPDISTNTSTLAKDGDILQDTLADHTAVEDNSKAEKPVLYSTENFKIRIGNIHPRSAHSQIKQKLTSLKLKPKKIKKMDKCDWAFATFCCEEDRQNAMKVLEGLQWRGKTLYVKKAEAATDPLLNRKRRADESDDAGVAKQQKVKLTADEYREKLLSKTCPLWNMSYNDQLKHKEDKIKNILSSLKQEMMKAYNDSKLPKSEYPNTDYKDLLLPIKPSPQTDGYRNKCEFTVGRHPISDEVTVGYRLGEYREGTVAVLEPTHSPNTSQAMKDVAFSFQDFVRQSAYAPFDPVSQQGHWVWLLVRETTLGGLMVMPTFVGEGLSQEELEGVKSNILKYYTEGDGKSFSVTSLYISISPRQKKSETETPPPVHLYGDETIEEQLLGLKFQISPSAFFQVNKEGAEVLYSAISEFAELTDDSSTVLDVCCGTGTIECSWHLSVVYNNLFIQRHDMMRLTVLHAMWNMVFVTIIMHAKKVVGIELVPQAVSDAEKNAKLNGVENISFKCGKAEAVLPELMNSMRSEEPVAIVDPPRAGLSKDCVSLFLVLFNLFFKLDMLFVYMYLSQPSLCFWF
ncbi:TRMT2A [Bugula neritina]|uniref:tRNA (uracil(54)-C(5))-methyltransferase n=1 Tax=Bugula neritina TaxID=10212 RepID=A0A7J7JA20_BUGNE|nr:TRMT2A [Bugula neritina]